MTTHSRAPAAAHAPPSRSEELLSADELRNWHKFVTHLSENLPLRDVILSSWQRSAAAGLHRDGAIEFRRVDDAELAALLEENRALVDVARPHLEWISAYMAGVEHVAYLTDRNGIVLFSVGDLAHSHALQLSPGTDWSERTMGTNGAGTAIAADRPIAVVGPEHYSTAFEDCTCTGAPIHYAGEVVGAIDVSTSAENAAPDRLALVAHVAFVIDRELALLQEAREHRWYRRMADELRARESELINANARLETLLGESREANARKERFIAALAHELRSPIAAITSAADVLDRYAEDPARVASTSGIVARQADYIAKIVDKLLETSRAANMRLNLKKARVDVAAVLDQAIEAVRPAVEASGQHVQVCLPDGPVAVHGDDTRLTQVFINLLDNASRYSEPGQTILVAASREDSHAVVRVRDHGCGITPETMPKIFELLYQADGPSSRSGLGLGLALVRGIVEAHGGSVAAHSDGAGCGTEFVVRLPCEADRRQRSL